jgi:hypothetical protein
MHKLLLRILSDKSIKPERIKRGISSNGGEEKRNPPPVYVPVQSLVFSPAHSEPPFFDNFQYSIK